MTLNRSRLSRLTVLAATVALTAGALGTSAVVAQDEELDGTGVKIDLIVKENINPFWVWMIDGATARAEELGVDLQACWGVKDPDPEGQTTCIENAIARGATTILIAPANAGEDLVQLLIVELHRLIRRGQSPRHPREGVLISVPAEPGQQKGLAELVQVVPALNDAHPPGLGQVGDGHGALSRTEHLPHLAVDQRLQAGGNALHNRPADAVAGW